MPIKSIEQTLNKEFPKITPVKENMEIHIPDIIDGIPNRNGFIWALNGSGGSGKSSLMLNFFKSGHLYRNKFNNIFYICPMASFLSVEDHPFSEHEEGRVFHELTEDVLESIFDELKIRKTEKEKPEYSIVIVDDMADSLKQNDIEKKLNQMLMKARHLQCAFIFTLQSYYYFPKILRKQLTNITIFKPKNAEEWSSIAKELLHMNKDDGNTVYDYVYSEPYSHLDIDTVDNKYYKNFNLLTFHTGTK
jgi:hypothetical protein